VVKRQQDGFIVVDGAGILAYVAGVVYAAGQPAKIALLNGFERPDADLGQFGNLLERDAPVAADLRKS
jgi:hypothetical protein